MRKSVVYMILLVGKTFGARNHLKVRFEGTNAFIIPLLHS